MQYYAIQTQWTENMVAEMVRARRKFSGVSGLANARFSGGFAPVELAKGNPYIPARTCI